MTAKSGPGVFDLILVGCCIYGCVVGSMAWFSASRQHSAELETAMGRSQHTREVLAAWEQVQQAGNFAAIMLLIAAASLVVMLVVFFMNQGLPGELTSNRDETPPDVEQQ